MRDPIVDMSPDQKRMRVEKLRVDLGQFGYSIVRTEWLHALLDQAAASKKMEAKHEDRRATVS